MQWDIIKENNLRIGYFSHITRNVVTSSAAPPPTSAVRLIFLFDNFPSAMCPRYRRSSLTYLLLKFLRRVTRAKMRSQMLIAHCQPTFK